MATSSTPVLESSLTAGRRITKSGNSLHGPRLVMVFWAVGKNLSTDYIYEFISQLFTGWYKLWACICKLQACVMWWFSWSRGFLSDQTRLKSSNFMLHQRQSLWGREQKLPMQGCRSRQYEARRIKLLPNKKADCEQHDIYLKHDLKTF